MLRQGQCVIARAVAELCERGSAVVGRKRPGRAENLFSGLAFDSLPEGASVIPDCAFRWGNLAREVRGNRIFDVGLGFWLQVTEI